MGQAIEIVEIDEKYSIAHENGVGNVFRNNEVWKDITKYDLAVAETISQLRAEISNLKKERASTREKIIDIHDHIKNQEITDFGADQFTFVDPNSPDIGYPEHFGDEPTGPDFDFPEQYR